MELFPYTTESISLTGTKKKLRETENSEQEVQTEEISYKSRGMATRPLVDKETQFDHKVKVKDSGSIEDFLKKVEPLMTKELLKSSKAFQCNP
jgi:hypothetical protein